MPVFNDPNFPKPGTKPTHTPPPVSPTVEDAIARLKNSAAAVKPTVREAATAVPLKRLNEIQPPPRLIEAIEPVQQQAYEPYNPYARKHREVAKATDRTAETVALYSAVAALVVAGALLLSTFFVQKIAEKQIAKAIHKAATPFSETADVKFGGVTVSLFKQSVTIKNIQITLAKNDETITIAAARAWGLDWPTLKQIAMTRKPTLPKTMKVSLTNVHMDGAALGPQAAAMLQAMGYEDVTFSTYTDLAMNKGNFDLKALHVDAKKMGRFDLSLQLGHVTMPSQAEIDRLKKDPKLLLSEAGELTKATIRGFSFDFQDATITRRVVNFMERNGETSPLALAKMAYEINSGSRDPASVDFVKPALATLVQFFERPSTLTLTAEPREEIPFVSLLDEKTGGSINELAHKLNLTLQ